jgi:hypothetical protein
MAGVVDADTHIAESEAMWSYIDKETYPRRPILAKIPEDTWYKERNAFWLIDGEIFPKPAGKGSFSLITPSAQKKESGRGDIHLSAREITDPAARVKDMDKIGVEIQVIYPTLFLVYLTDDPKLEVALCRAYNRFVRRRGLRPSTRSAQMGRHLAAARHRGVTGGNEVGERTRRRRSFLSRYGRQSDSGQSLL